MSEAHHRADDPPLMQVIRAVPLTWFLWLLGVIVVWAASQFYGLQAVASKVSDMTVKFEAMSKKVEDNNGKMIEYGFQISDLRMRLDRLERLIERKP